jgi:hypothetical protein
MAGANHRVVPNHGPHRCFQWAGPFRTVRSRQLVDDLGSLPALCAVIAGAGGAE